MAWEPVPTYWKEDLVAAAILLTPMALLVLWQLWEHGGVW